MKLTNAQKKLERAGFAVTWNEPMLSSFSGEMLPPSQMTARRGSHAVECIRNGRGEELATIRVRSISDHDDMQSDYCAGSFWPSIASAIAAVARYESSK